MQWLQNDLSVLLSTYGYGAVAVLLALESVGLPIPGATLLVGAAVYAGATQSLDIAGVIAASITGAAIGDSLAYWLGRRGASTFLQRYGRYVGLTERKLRLGASLFAQHGGKLVFAARFVAFLRVVTMYVAGISCMDWRRFALFNLAGSAAWALVFGVSAYHLGQQAHRLTGPLSLTLLVLGVTGIVAAAFYLKRYSEQLSAAAEVVSDRQASPLV